MSVAVGDTITVVWTSGLNGIFGGSRAFAVGIVNKFIFHRGYQRIVFYGLRSGPTPDAAGIVRLDEEGIGWIRGAYAEDSREVAALHVAHALGTANG